MGIHKIGKLTQLSSQQSQSDSMWNVDCSLFTVQTEPDARAFEFCSNLFTREIPYLD